MIHYDDATKTVSKFQFRTEPLEFGPKLDADVALLHDLALRGLYVFPWVCMLPFLGDAAHDLFVRRMETRGDRLWLQAECDRRHPELERRLACLKRVTASTYDSACGCNKPKPFSFPEIPVGSTLRAMLPPSVRITAHTPLPGSRRHCDFEVQPGYDLSRTARVEVIDMDDRCRRGQNRNRCEIPREAARTPGRLRPRGRAATADVLYRPDRSSCRPTGVRCSRAGWSGLVRPSRRPNRLRPSDRR